MPQKLFLINGTEGDNMILRSCVKNLNVNHIITSIIEHHAVTHTVEEREIIKNKDYLC